MDVGFIGLGHMGSGMARNLIKAGHRVRVWNRSWAASEDLGRDGAEVVAAPGEAFDADAVITMLSADDVVREVILDQGLLAGAHRGLVHVVSSTISVAFAQELERAHEAAGIGYVAAPVLGRPDVAAAGELNILVAGRPDAVARVQPLLDALGKRIWPIGDQPHLANLAKLACNFTLASAIETMAEAFALARRYDLDPQILMEVLTGSLFAAPAYKTYGPMIVEQRYEPANFKLPLGLKDVRLALEAGEAVGAPLPFASVLRDNFIDAIGHGDRDKDWSAIAAVAARRAGLEAGR
ncbi:MAG: oxidoreductase [Phenylobacterium sp.]|uniref:NAD(P)-dependent oxidoreductase n=1 Tax=Phenylobacterium sp. TaxID=1871053 RepID=UPI00261A5606|nr:NAD(P)-dependent oxidoreductase [Phenylobacterium sp.]MDB5499845.1 oxidoreductase [Phenylobacterium sp.]